MALLVLGFPDLAAAADVVPELLGCAPRTAEGLGTTLIEALGERPRPELPAGAAWLLVEFGANELCEAVASARAAADEMGRPCLVVTDPAHRAALWRIREAGAGPATRLTDGSQACPGWEDATCRPNDSAPTCVALPTCRPRKAGGARGTGISVRAACTCA